jgi:hypothetical protein
MRLAALRSGLAAALLALALTPLAAGALIIDAGISVAPNGDIVFSWYQNGPPQPNYSYVGYDVYRRATDNCSEWVRVTGEMVPLVGGELTYEIVDNPPPGHTYQYQVRPVDADRVQVFPGPCDCSSSEFVSTPGFSTPIFHGRLRDHGWAAYLEPCVGSCGPQGYISPIPEALIPYLDTGTALNIYGQSGCASLEGCSINVDHFEVVVCDDIVPARRTSWGQVKTIYR